MEIRTPHCFAPLALALALLPAVSSAQWKTHWDYEGPLGPEHWGELDPAYALCNAGKEQSPIDIGSARRAALPALHFESSSRPLRYLVNNGATIRVNYHDAPGSGDSLTVDGVRYQLTQLHFHRPSEEYLHGKTFDMVAHLMYQAGDGNVAGVAVMLKAGRENATIRQLWNVMPATESRVLLDYSHQEQEVPGVSIDPAGLLPRELGYYTYEGSVTAPPCTEGVRWYVLKTPVEISRGEIAEFARLYPHDVRPPQPLNGRLVQESE